MASGVHTRDNFIVKKSYISPIGLQLAPRIKNTTFLITRYNFIYVACYIFFGVEINFL